MKWLWLHALLRTHTYQRYMKEKREAQQVQVFDPWDRTTRWSLQPTKEKQQ